MTKKQQTVQPKDLQENLEQYIIAAQEGRLKLDPPVLTADKEAVYNGVRAYVERIRSLVLPQFSETIDQIWSDIFADDLLSELLMPNVRLKKDKEFNKNGLCRILCVMISNEVYQERNKREYVRLLEQTQNDCSYRKMLHEGIENRETIKRLREIIAKTKV